MVRAEFQKTQVQAIEQLLLSGDVFTFGGLEAAARRDFAVNNPSGLVRGLVSRLHDEGKISFSHEGRTIVLRAVQPVGLY